jgi:hypothetical protein
MTDPDTRSDIGTFIHVLQEQSFGKPMQNHHQIPGDERCQHFVLTYTFLK